MNRDSDLVHILQMHSFVIRRLAGTRKSLPGKVIGGA